MRAAGDSQANMDRFNAQHQVTYGYQLAGRTIQIVNLRVTGLGLMPALPWPRRRERPPAQPAETRLVLLPGGEQRGVAVYRFDELSPGQRLCGRSEEHTSETPVPNAHLVCRLLL